MYKSILLLFVLLTNIIAFDDEGRNNDDPGEYIELVNSPFQDSGNVDGSNSDWHDAYYFRVSQPGDVTITLTSNTDLDFKLGITYANQEITRDTSSNNVKRFTFNAQANTNYYLTLFDNEWRDQSNPYTLKIEFPSESTPATIENLVNESCPTGYTLDLSTNYLTNGDFHILDERTAQPSNVPPNTLLSQGTWKTDAYYQGNNRYPNDNDSPNDTTSSINQNDIVTSDVAAFRFPGNDEYGMGSQNYLYFNGNDLNRPAIAWEAENISVTPNDKYIFVAHFSNALYSDKYLDAADPKMKMAYKDSSWKDLSSSYYTIPRDTPSTNKSTSADKWYKLSYLITPNSNNINLRIWDGSYEKGNYGDDLAISGVGLYKCKPDNVPQNNGACYAISDIQNKLYKVTMAPGSDPLPVATTVDIVGANDNLDGEGGAYNSEDGLVYAFNESSSGIKQYSIDPNTGQAQYIKTYTNMKKNVVGAAFYGGYFYVIAKTRDGDATLYKITTNDWSIISTKNVNGDTTDADALAINKDGEAYIITDNNKKLYSFDINSAKATYKLTISTNTDAEGLSFAQDGNLYVENSEESTSDDTDKIFKIDLSTGELIPAAQIPHSDNIDIESLSCNVEVPTNSDTPNAMLLTRGDSNNNDKTNVYVFHIDTDSDTITNFHLLKKLDKKFRALAYHNGKFYTSDMSGNIYTIDIESGNYTLDTTFGKIDSSAVMGMDFDENENILYSIWNSSEDEQRKLRKYSPSTGSSSILATVPSSDHYIDYGVAYFGDGKTVVSVGSGAVRFINNSTIGEHITSEEWCVYGGEYVGGDKGYFVNAESNDLSIYKLDGTSWSKIYTYGDKTSGNKAEAIALEHENSSPPAETLPNVSISDVAKYEGDSGLTEYVVTITLDKPAQSDLTCTYSTEDGTAKRSDDDYQYASGTKTIPKGTTSFTIKVYAKGDTKVEDDEYFYLNIKITN